jgi:Mg2+/citrate symporter
VSNIEEIEDAMGVISELLELCKQQHNAAGDCLKEFKLDLRIFDKQTGELVKAGNNLQANIEKGVSLGVMASLQTAIGKSLADTPKIIESALNPVFKRLDMVATGAMFRVETAENTIARAEKANARLDRAVLTLGWKMAGIACGVACVLAGVLVLSVYLAVWWNRTELESLTAQKAVMEKNIEELSKRKGDVHFSLCSDKQRPCVEVEDKAYEIEKQNFYILKGVR